MCTWCAPPSSTANLNSSARRSEKQRWRSKKIIDFVPNCRLVGVFLLEGRESFPNMLWMVVSNILYVHPYLGKIPILTNIFQVGRNHQLDVVTSIFPELFAWTIRIVHETGFGGKMNPMCFFQIWVAQPSSHIWCLYIYISPNLRSVLGHFNLTHSIHVWYIYLHLP